MRIAVVFAVLSMIGCLCGCPHPGPQPNPVPPAPSRVDAGPSCATACANLRALRCPAGDPTAGGASCEDVCQNVQASGVFVWNVGCISYVSSCSAADLCEENHRP